MCVTSDNCGPGCRSVGHLLDEEARIMVGRAYQKAQGILSQHRDKLNKVGWQNRMFTSKLKPTKIICLFPGRFLAAHNLPIISRLAQYCALKMLSFCKKKLRKKCRFVKDARSVSLYPYNQSQILQYMLSLLNKLTLIKSIANFGDK